MGMLVDWIDHRSIIDLNLWAVVSIVIILEELTERQKHGNRK